MVDESPEPALRWILDPSVVDRVRAWAVEVDGVEVGDRGRAHARLEALARERGAAAAAIAIGEVEGIDAARRLYRSFGVDPTRHRPSSEALMRRARKGQSIHRLNEVVDVGNWVSLEWLLPLGLYDRDRVVGDQATVRVGGTGEEYAGIRKGPVHLEGRLCVADREGPFGSPTSDSERTCVRDGTTRVAAIVFAPADVEPDRLRGAGEALGRRLVEHAGGRVVLSVEVTAESDGSSSYPRSR